MVHTQRASIILCLADGLPDLPGKRLDFYHRERSAGVAIHHDGVRDAGAAPGFAGVVQQVREIGEGAVFVL